MTGCCSDFNTIINVVKGSKYLKSELAFLKIYKYTTKSENVYDDGRCRELGKKNRATEGGQIIKKMHYFCSAFD